jgi:thioredoxin-related protein
MRQLLCLLLPIPLMANIQVITTSSNNTSASTSEKGISLRPFGTTGIKWTEGLTLEQVKQKAKQENKYIFLDCFTTWCVPCKRMDKMVYSSDTVGNYYNEKFISVKVQMDRTKNDNSFIQSWYRDADSINKRYCEGYPSFIFLSPQGIIVHADKGYKTVPEFIALAKTAIQSSKAYYDSYSDYESLLADYKRGIKHYDRMPLLISTAYKKGDKDFGKQLMDEHTVYVAGLPRHKRYTRENIELWAGFLLGSEKKRFHFFYKDGDYIDRMMNQKGYAAKVIDKTIEYEIIQPFYKTQPGGEIMVPGLFTKNKKTVDIEADWEKLRKTIRRKFNAYYAKRNVLNARINWYDKHRNYTAFVKYSLIKLDKYYNDSLDRALASNINHLAWTCFLTVTDKLLITQVIPWMEKAVRQNPERSDFIDTYANLLYKAGQRDAAIEWEAKAASISPTKSYSKIVEQMKKGECTYLNAGAVWK